MVNKRTERKAKGEGGGGSEGEGEGELTKAILTMPFSLCYIGPAYVGRLLTCFRISAL